MKKFKLMGFHFECEDRFNYASMDKDGTYWVYIEEPFRLNPESLALAWDICDGMMQVFPQPITTPQSRVDCFVPDTCGWENSKVAI